MPSVTDSGSFSVGGYMRRLAGSLVALACLVLLALAASGCERVQDRNVTVCAEFLMFHDGWSPVHEDELRPGDLVFATSSPNPVFRHEGGRTPEFAWREPGVIVRDGVTYGVVGAGAVKALSATELLGVRYLLYDGPFDEGLADILAKLPNLDILIVNCGSERSIPLDFGPLLAKLSHFSINPYWLPRYVYRCRKDLGPEVSFWSTGDFADARLEAAQGGWTRSGFKSLFAFEGAVDPRSVPLGLSSPGSLRRVDLLTCSGSFDETHVELLKQCTSLRELRIELADPSRLFSLMEYLPGLEHLDLGIQVYLENLWVTENFVSKSECEAALSRLRSLTYRNFCLNDDLQLGVVLGGLDPSKVTRLSFYRERHTMIGLESLRRFKQLEYLNLSAYECAVTWQEFSDVVCSFKNLRSLSLDNADGLDIQCLTDTAHIRRLFLSGAEIDTGGKVSSSCSQVFLMGCVLAPGVLKCLSDPGREVVLYDCTVEPEGHVASGTFDKLRVWNSNLSDANLIDIVARSSVRLLDISYCSVSSRDLSFLLGKVRCDDLWGYALRLSDAPGKPNAEGGSLTCGTRTHIYIANTPNSGLGADCFGPRPEGEYACLMIRISDQTPPELDMDFVYGGPFGLSRRESMLGMSLTRTMLFLQPERQHPFVTNRECFETLDSLSYRYRKD